MAHRNYTKLAESAALATYLAAPPRAIGIYEDIGVDDTMIPDANQSLLRIYELEQQRAILALERCRQINLLLMKEEITQKEFLAFMKRDEETQAAESKLEKRIRFDALEGIGPLGSKAIREEWFNPVYRPGYKEYLEDKACPRPTTAAEYRIYLGSKKN